MKRLKVLVLEDNLLVGEGLVDSLVSLGHEGVLAGSLGRARTLAQEHPDLDVALVDAGLQDGEHGAEYLSWLARERPGVRRILISGLESSQVGVHPAVEIFLKKPFGVGELSAALLLR